MIILYYNYILLLLWLSFLYPRSIALFENGDWEYIWEQVERSEKCERKLQLNKFLKSVKSRLHALWLAFGVLKEFSDVFYQSA